MKVIPYNLLYTLSQILHALAVILFGSASKGEDILESDIDLFLTSKERKLDISAA